MTLSYRNLMLRYHDSTPEKEYDLIRLEMETLAPIRDSSLDIELLASLPGSTLLRDFSAELTPIVPYNHKEYATALAAFLLVGPTSTKSFIHFSIAAEEIRQALRITNWQIKTGLETGITADLVSNRGRTQRSKSMWEIACSQKGIALKEKALIVHK